MLDIIGTFSGVIHALVLQRRIHKSTTVLNIVTQSRVGTEAAQKPTSEKPTRGDTEDQLLDFGFQEITLQQRVAWLREEMGINGETGERMVPLFARPLPGANADAPATAFMLASPFELGHTPLISMGLGVIALVVSIILFTAETNSLAREVWVTCVAILFTVMIFSLVPIRCAALFLEAGLGLIAFSYSLIKRRWNRMKEGLGV
jgi:hypothetical protein